MSLKSTVSTLDSSSLWAGLWIRWRGKKVFLIAAIEEEGGLYQVHYDHKGVTYIDLDVPRQEIGKAQLIED
ncbi:MAG: hypothetical protein EOM45_14885 [Clostridia bacterium]|nr:hypothetical protein [Clostridia bacterium]